MQPSHARLSGHLELCILDPDGRVLERYENHNAVAPFGRTLILRALQGQTTTQRLEPFLADERFQLGSERGLEQEGVLRLKEPEQLDAQERGGRLAIGFRGVASTEGKIIGGGLAAFYKEKGSNKIHSGVYNFAKVRAAVEVRPEMPLLLNFTLTVG